MGQTDILDPARATALAATLGLDEDFEEGVALPPFFHQIYFWDAQKPTHLGRDGHPKVGQGLIPDLGLPRRMWAGGQLDFERPLRCGLAAEKRSRCTMVEEKQGRSGPLAFVTLEHEFWQENTLCVRECQDLVYRMDPSKAGPKPVPRYSEKDPTRRREVTFDSTTLFRYSALTFNGHRIHYDLSYARDVEGYGGLVVHGPLLAQLLMFFATEEMGALAHFAFRGVSPLTDGQTATLCAAGSSFWVETSDGQLIMSAEAEI